MPLPVPGPTAQLLPRALGLRRVDLQPPAPGPPRRHLAPTCPRSPGWVRGPGSSRRARSELRREACRFIAGRRWRGAPANRNLGPALHALRAELQARVRPPR
eukprot:513764-Alexandrium_andersonii.AAC.1